MMVKTFNVVKELRKRTNDTEASLIEARLTGASIRFFCAHLIYLDLCTLKCLLNLRCDIKDDPCRLVQPHLVQ